MSWPPADSPFWAIVKVLSRQLVVIVSFFAYYHSNFAEADFKTLMTLLLADAGMTTISEKIRKE